MIAFIIDIVLTGGFVAYGMNTHDSPWSDFPVTAAPFVIALVIAWLIIPRVREQPFSLVSGAIVAILTAGIGLALRAGFGQGVSGAFPIVATAMIAAFFLGWRLIALLINQVRQKQQSA